MISLAWPWLLAVLPVPLLVYLFLPTATSNQVALRVPFYDSMSSIDSGGVQSSGVVRLICMILIWLLVVLAAARPQWVDKPDLIPVSGRDLMLAVDISESMKAADMLEQGIAENRLNAVKRVAKKFIKNREGDRIGLILFGTQAYLQSPLSFDHTTVSTLLQEAAIGIAGKKTAIGDAVGLAVKRLREHYGDREDTEKVLILLTDGANTAGILDPLRAAELAKVAQLKIYTIGVGADSSVTTNLFGQRIVAPSNDIDEETLSTMAKLTGGRYFRALDVKTLDGIYALIDQLEPLEEQSKRLRPTIELFYLPLALAALIALGLSLLSEAVVGKLLNRIRRVAGARGNPRDSVPNQR